MKLMRRAAILVGAALIAGFGQSAWAIPGGWSEADVDDANVVSAARFAVAAQQQTMASEDETAELALVRILSARQQVVAGMNYEITLQVRVGETLKTATVRVWDQPWRKPRRELTSWDWMGVKRSFRTSS